MKTRTFLAIALAVMMIFTLASCKKEEKTEETEETKELKTVGDAYDIGGIDGMYGFDSEYFYYVFEDEGTWIRVSAEIDEKIYDDLAAVDVVDDDYAEQICELVSPLEISEVTDLSAGIPSQEELDKLIGKTGQDLIDNGYGYDGAYFGEDSTVYVLNKGDYQFEFTFNEIVENAEEAYPEEELPALTVKSVQFYGISENATG